MAIINSYPTATPVGSDLIIGTDVSTTPNSTKTFTIDSINALSTGTPAAGTLNTVALFTGAVALGNSTIVRSGAGATSVYTFGGGTAISNTSITTSDLTTSGNTILGNAGTDTLTVNAATFYNGNIQSLGTNTFGGQTTFSVPVNIPTTPVASTNAASKAYVDGIVGYTTYVARVTQASTAAPVATIIANDTGLTFTWARTGTGVFTVTPSSAFVVNKTWIQMTGGDVSTGVTMVTVKNITTASASAVNSNLINGAVADGITAAFIEIRIYP